MAFAGGFTEPEVGNAARRGGSRTAEKTEAAAEVMIERLIGEIHRESGRLLETGEGSETGLAGR